MDLLNLSRIMHQYRIHDPDSAPEQSQPALRQLHEAFGVIPNLAATMAESPTLLRGFVGAFTNFHGGTFDSAQRQALLLSNAVANASPWPVAFHSTMALKEGILPADVGALREGRHPADPALAALSAFTRALINKRGRVDSTELRAFANAGFAPAQALEVIAGVAVSAMANYAAHITNPALEAPFQPQAWSQP